MLSDDVADLNHKQSLTHTQLSYHRCGRLNQPTDLCHLSPSQIQYIFLHHAILDGITSVWTDIPVDQLAKRISELSEENEEGDSGFEVEFNVRLEKLIHIHIECIFHY